MNRAISNWLAGGVTAVPAVLFLIYVLVSFQGQYYFSTYVIVGGVFVAASLMAGAWVSSHITTQTSRSGRFARLFGGSLAAWIFSLIILGVLSLTPLCMGQNNGDGNNDIGMCGFYVVLAAVFYSVPISANGCGLWGGNSHTGETACKNNA